MDLDQTISACKNGDQKAFRDLMMKYSDFAFSVAFRILNEEESSRDVVQESFITVWQKIDSFKTTRKFSNWLYRIVVNKCFDLLRKNKNRFTDLQMQSGIIKDLISDENPERILTNKELGILIRNLTEQLSPKQKIVFTLCELEGLNHEDIAEITKLSKSSIKSNLHHARRNIAENLRKIH